MQNMGHSTRSPDFPKLNSLILGNKNSNNFIINSLKSISVHGFKDVAPTLQMK